MQATASNNHRSNAKPIWFLIISMVLAIGGILSITIYFVFLIGDLVCFSIQLLNNLLLLSFYMIGNPESVTFHLSKPFQMTVWGLTILAMAFDPVSLVIDLLNGNDRFRDLGWLVLAIVYLPMLLAQLFNLIS